MKAFNEYRGGGPSDGEEPAGEIGDGKQFPPILLPAYFGRATGAGRPMAVYRFDSAVRLEDQERRIYKFIGHKTSEQFRELVGNWAANIAYDSNGHPLFRDDHDSPTC